MLRRLRTPLATTAGLTAAGLADRFFTPPLKPLSTAAAAAGSIGSVQLFQYEVRNMPFFSFQTSHGEIDPCDV